MFTNVWKKLLSNMLTRSFLLPCSGTARFNSLSSSKHQQSRSSLSLISSLLIHLSGIGHSKSRLWRIHVAMISFDIFFTYFGSSEMRFQMLGSYRKRPLRIPIVCSLRTQGVFKASELLKHWIFQSIGVFKSSVKSFCLWEATLAIFLASWKLTQGTTCFQC